jgi:hypothetical protein
MERDEGTSGAAAPSKRHWQCEACGHWVRPLRPHWIWRVAEVGAWVLLPGLVAVSSKGPGLVLLPGVVLIGGFLFGPLHAQAWADAHCPDCGKVIYPPKKKPRR